MKQLKGEAEKEKWSSIDHRYMTDESESDEEDVVRQHKLQWRSQGRPCNSPGMSMHKGNIIANVNFCSRAK